MAVYVDDYISSKFAGHLVADTHEELEAFARRIGLDPAWIQKPGTFQEHYDVTRTKRFRAIAAGAIPVSVRDIVRIVAAKRGPSTPRHRHLKVIK